MPNIHHSRPPWPSSVPAFVLEGLAVYAHLSPRLPTPHLVVYLRAEPELLLSRIVRRGRPFERGRQATDLTELTRRYDKPFRPYPGRYDFVQKAADEGALLDQVYGKLRP